MSKSFLSKGLKVGIGAIAGLMLFGCSTALTPPNLGSLYNRSAQYHGVDRNPVIVIPGILGSKLVDRESGEIVWGAFGRGTANPGKPSGALLASLPMRPGAPLDQLEDGVVATAALDRLKLELLYVPVSLQAYANILLSLGAGGYQDQQLSEAGAIDYGNDHFTCFQFPYDWRRSNVDNARRLHEFILEKRAYVAAEMEKRFGVKNPDIKFDIVAHSMGGLISRYYLRYGAAELPDQGPLPEMNWAGARFVENIVLIGTPNGGSAKAVEQLVEGLNLKPIAFYHPAILGTMPAIYELLPRPRHGALIEQASGKALDFYDPALWEQFGWGLVNPRGEQVLQMLLPEVKDQAERERIAREHLRKCLQNAKRFHEALDVPAKLPAGVSMRLIAGDAQLTDAVLGVNGESGHLSIVSKQAGDGTVLRSSALLDERTGQEWQPMVNTPIDWDHVMFLFTNHLGLTKDPIFTDNVLYFLLERPR